MVRTRVRLMLAALGVIIAVAMTPRAAIAVTLEDYPSSPLVQYNVGSAPALLTPSQLLGGLTSANNVYSDMSISEILGGYRASSTGTSSYNVFDFSTPLAKKYEYVIGDYDTDNIPPASQLYLDFYFVSDDWSTFPVGVEYSVVSPSLVQSVLLMNSSGTSSLNSDVMDLPCSAFVLDEVKYYRQSIVQQQPNEQWSNVPNSASSSMRYPFHAKAQSGTTGLKGFVIRGHINVPSYSTISGYDMSLFFGIDNLGIRNVIYDSDVMATINGSSSQSSTGVPVSATITTSTHNQTETLMDTDGSDDIVSGLTGGGYDGFVSRFGFIAQTIQYVTGFYQALVGSTSSGIVTFPGVTVLGITLIPETAVNINNGAYGLRPVVQTIRPLLTGIACLAWIFWVYHDFRKQFLDVSEVDE